MTVREWIRQGAVEGSEGSAGPGINQMLRQIEKHGSDVNCQASVLGSLCDQYIRVPKDRQAAKCAIAGIASANLALQKLKARLAKAKPAKGAHA